MKTANKNFPVSRVATDPTTGIQYTSYYDLFTVGAGYLDTVAALNNSDTANGTALSPVANVDPLTGTVSISDIAGQQVIWGNKSFGAPTLSGY
jgi:hypothetical protein